MTYEGCYTLNVVIMNRFIKHRKILLLVAAVLVCGVFIFFYSSSRSVSQQEANVMCQKLHADMSANIKSVPGYTILDTTRYCVATDPDEMNNSDYSFEAVYRLSKTGRHSAAVVKEDLESFAEQLPRTSFTVLVRNDNALDGQPDNICVTATTLIQGEYDGEIYNSNIENTSEYAKPATASGFDNCKSLTR